MAHCMNSIAANSEIAALPRSTDSTHDPNRTGRSEVMVRVSLSRDETQKRTNSAVGGQSPEDTDADQAQKYNHIQSGKLTSIWFGS